MSFSKTPTGQTVEMVSASYAIGLEMLRDRPDMDEWMDWEVERLVEGVTKSVQPVITIRTGEAFNSQIISARFYWVPNIEEFKEAYRRDIAKSYDEGYKQAIEDLGV